MNPARNCA